MLFNSVTFLIFFSVVLLLHHLPLPWKLKKANLLGASYIFYAAWNPPFVILIWISTLVDWFAAARLPRARSRGARRFLLGLSLVCNLGLLGYFKYGGFLLENFAVSLRGLGVAYEPASPSIVLPVGISFYTFQTLSYTLDVYRGKMEPWRSFLDFALFVTFFPQLVAGPILRGGDFLPQCETPRRATPQQLSWGLSLLCVGLFQKIVIADGVMAPISDLAFGAGGRLEFMDAWGAALAFSVQVFCDFAGYSTCAIGAAMCLGFVIPENFRYPLASTGCVDFWRRWHITLGTWLRDYLFMPLGGYRRGRRRAFANLMVTMLLCGLWHGASWNFVLFGGMHGVLIGSDRAVRRRYGRAPFWRTRLGRYVLCGITAVLFTLTAAVFRSRGLLHALASLQGMLVPAGGGGLSMLTWRQDLVALLVFSALFHWHWFMRDRTLAKLAARAPWWLRGAVVGLLLTAIVTFSGSDRAFIYFQF